jgi:hypothetical protein
MAISVPTGRFVITIGLDEEGDNALAFEYEGISNLQAVGYLTTVLDIIRQHNAHSWNATHLEPDEPSEDEPPDGEAPG